MRVDQNKQLQQLLAKPVFSANEARKLGIHPSRLSYYVKLNLIERIGRGFYRSMQSELDVDVQWEDLVMTAKSVPNGVICLLSALALYNLTDQLPREHWLAIPHATTVPKRANTRFVRIRDVETGLDQLTLGGETVPIFNRERTIVDAFRFLSQEVAIKALKEAVKLPKGQFNLRRLEDYARDFHLDLTPYVVTVTT